MFRSTALSITITAITASLAPAARANTKSAVVVTDFSDNPWKLETFKEDGKLTHNEGDLLVVHFDAPESEAKTTYKAGNDEEITLEPKQIYVFYFPDVDKRGERLWHLVDSKGKAKGDIMFHFNASNPDAKRLMVPYTMDPSTLENLEKKVKFGPRTMEIEENAW